MKLRIIFSFALVACLCLGLARDAAAVGPCGAVCSGPNEPCALRCSLGSFVTTCGELGPCVGFAAEPASLEDLGAEALNGSCELDLAINLSPATAADESNALADKIAAWVRVSAEALGSALGRLHPALA